VNPQTKNIVVGVGVAAAIIFLLYGCGGDKYYCIQWDDAGNCLDYGPTY